MVIKYQINSYYIFFLAIVGVFTNNILAVISVFTNNSSVIKCILRDTNRLKKITNQMETKLRLIDTYFTTATILNWYPLLEKDVFKDIIIESLRFAVKSKRANIFAFVIMSNHFHVVWQILPPSELNKVRQNLLKFTAQQFKFLLINDTLNIEDTYKTETKNFDILNLFRVDKADRKHQFWKRNPLSVEILSEKVLQQKINYIHNNLTRKNLDDVNYKYSSAYYYETGVKNWDFLL